MINLATGQKVKTIQAGAHLSHPEGMAVDPKRPLAFVAIANDDQIGVINTKTPDAEANALARTADGRRDDARPR